MRTTLIKFSASPFRLWIYFLCVHEVVKIKFKKNCVKKEGGPTQHYSQVARLPLVDATSILNTQDVLRSPEARLSTPQKAQSTDWILLLY